MVLSRALKRKGIFLTEGFNIALRRYEHLPPPIGATQQCDMCFCQKSHLSSSSFYSDKEDVQQRWGGISGSRTTTWHTICTVEQLIALANNGFTVGFVRLLVYTFRMGYGLWALGMRECGGILL